MDRRRFLTLFAATGGGLALLVPATQDKTGVVKLDVKTMRRDGDTITVELKR